MSKKKPWQKKLEKKLLLTLAPPVAYWWLRFFNYTALKNNKELLDTYNLDELEGRIRSHENPSIIALWHSRLAFGPTSYHYSQGIGATIMVSKGFDGELTNRMLHYFSNMDGARGSASKDGTGKGGREALDEMVEHGKAGRDLVLTPDGPQGPQYKAKTGAIHLAKKTGMPIYPVSANADKYFDTRSWDKLRVPYPYARFVYIAGDPITVPGDADDAMIEEKRLELENSLMKLTEFTDNYFTKDQ